MKKRMHTLLTIILFISVGSLLYSTYIEAMGWMRMYDSMGLKGSLYFALWNHKYLGAAIFLLAGANYVVFGKIISIQGSKSVSKKAAQ